ncbi:hypothetical protein SKAU_G00387850 [Synaphobranchus kaupii]|uniref:Uncharacterized protein n=1 Tax=Synaphobranchus kaupii TaxID=118154 RepID=A0A9Q1IBB4_SYNKA|nr:hypothetical protein SKAU_G00387850 [Synaphobranchus kaupii]
MKKSQVNCLHLLQAGVGGRRLAPAGVRYRSSGRGVWKQLLAWATALLSREPGCMEDPHIPKEGYGLDLMHVPR